MPPAPKDNNPFGIQVNAMLRARDMTQAELATRMGKNLSYLNQVITGHRPAAPVTVRQIAAALGASEAEQLRLHHGAALARGYEIGPVRA